MMHKPWLWIVSFMAVVFYYARFIEPNWQEVKRFSVTLPRLSQPFQKYRVALISDPHVESKASLRRLQQAVNRINARKPDLVVIPGDILSYHYEDYVDDLIAVLGQIQAPDGVYAVPGNHDHFRGRGAHLRYILRAAGVVDLSNDVHTIYRGEHSLHLAGVDDAVRIRARLDLVLAHLPPYGAAILLAHEPDYAYVAAATQRFDLQLSGHTHGGQVRIPLLPPIRRVTLGTRFTQGFHMIDDMALYVTRGIGMVNKPLRLFCRPEIVIIKLKAPKRRKFGWF